MKALWYDEQKGPGAIRSGEQPAPLIGDADVLVRIKAFSLNHLDLWIMEGNYPGRIPLPHIFGSDAAGVVERVGASVRHVRPGDAVVVFPGLSCGRCEACLTGRDNECEEFSLLGTQTPGVSAELSCIPAANVFPKPDGVSFEEAAGIGITYTTAWNSLVQRANVRPGDRVLIHSAGSGAGTALVQTAKLFGASVLATVGDEWKRERAKALGADFVVNYRQEDVREAVKNHTDGHMADIVVDHVGAATINQSLSCLRRGGRLVTFGATSGDEAPVSLRRVFGRNIAIHGVYVGPKSAFLRVLRLVPSGLRTVVDSVFEASDARAAYEKMLSRRVFGKIVVRM